jgi:methyl-accepting chemotaxis protein
VEESAAAAESLREQAHKLASAVAGFKLEASTQADTLSAATSGAPQPMLHGSAPGDSAHAEQARAAIVQARQRAAAPQQRSSAPAAPSASDWKSF